jgi:hypothetical protein
MQLKPEVSFPSFVLKVITLPANSACPFFTRRSCTGLSDCLTARQTALTHQLSALEHFCRHEWQTRREQIIRGLLNARMQVQEFAKPGPSGEN